VSRGIFLRLVLSFFWHFSGIFLAYFSVVLFFRRRIKMSALSKIEFERDLDCIDISLFAQCRALISEGMAAEVDQLIERCSGAESQDELDRILLIKGLATGSTALIN
jgi:hypothetical protein